MHILIVKVNARKGYGSIPLGVGIDIVRALAQCKSTKLGWVQIL
jgi:hypothetical protein